MLKQFLISCSISLSLLLISAENSSPADAEKDWNQKTQGRNLISGKQLTFDPEPRYPLTAKGGSDAADLTDGKFAKDDHLLWFRPEAVAWLRAYSGVTIIADLGEIQPVGKAVIRICGGKPATGVVFPEQLEIWVSRDGKEYFRASAIKKLPATEAYLSDWKKFYYLPEQQDAAAQAYTHVFELPVCADARYVALRAPVYTPVSIISDEMALIEATSPERKLDGFNSAYNSPSRQLIHKTIVLRPRMDTFYVAEDIVLPNRLLWDDRREAKKGNVGYRINLPDAIERIPDETWPVETRTFAGAEKLNGRIIFHFRPSLQGDAWENRLKYAAHLLGPFFFRVNKGAVIPEGEKYAEFSGTVDSKITQTIRIPLKIVSIQPVPPMKDISINLGYIVNGYTAQWPEFYRTMRGCGFNTITIDGTNDKIGKEIYDLAREKGFRTKLELSPTGIMNNRNANVNEFRCTGLTAKDGVSACPAYRGKYYGEMLAWITEMVRKYPEIDFLDFDEESWEPRQFTQMLNCSRCDELRKKMGVDWKTYLTRVQADYLKPFREAAYKGAAPDHKPKIYFYAMDTLFGYGSEFGKIPFLGGDILYPEFCDKIGPSVYHRSPFRIRTEISNVYAKYPDPEKIVCWITAGAGAYNEGAFPEKTGQQLAEALMNGAGNIVYYRYQSFESPIDFVSHADVLRMLAPYENILLKGKKTALRSENKELVHTARSLGKETLLLIGNYETFRPAETLLKLPEGSVILDLRDQKKETCPKGGIRLNVPADDYRLYWIKTP